MNEQTSQEIQEIEISIEQAREVVELKDAIFRLMKNEDFKKVIDVGYFSNESRRLVGLLAQPSVNDTNKVYESLMGISRLEEYLRVAILQGKAMEQQIESSNQVLADIANEQ